MRLALDAHSTAEIRDYRCSGLLSELSDQICVGTAKAIRGGADNGHAMARMRHVSAVMTGS
jgi:hypothetical protein